MGVEEKSDLKIDDFLSIISTDSQNGDSSKSTTGKEDVSGLLSFRTPIVWQNAIAFLLLHLLAVIGIFTAPHMSLLTIIWGYLMAFISGFGITVGAHRLFSHRSFRVNPGLRLAFILAQTIAGQNCLWVWVRDHRQHHRFTDTDADPHNARRGFFFSHMGWLMMRKLPAVIEAGRTVPMKDLTSDPLVMFQKRWYKPMYVVFALGIPVGVPVWLWGESLINSFLASFVVRTCYILHITWLVNSWAHMFGTRPYDKEQLAAESVFVSMITVGEGWHNYHHRFPFDYRASGRPRAKYELSTMLIELAARMGWASHLRRADDCAIQRALATTAAATAAASFSAALRPDLLAAGKCE